MTTIQERVRKLIADRGLTQGAFASEIGIDPTKLSKSLTGTRRFSSLDLALIADACQVTVDWLVTGEEQEIALAARRSAGSSAEIALRLANEYATKRKDLAGQGRVQQWVFPAAISMHGRWVDQGVRLADAALECVRKAGRRTSESLYELIPEVFGIDVAVQELGQGFDGLAVATDRARLIIANTSPWPRRQRFTIAHELGHLLASDDQQIHEDENIHGKASKSGESEIRANAFAAAFLMPQSELRAKGRIDRDAFCALATELQVSPSALAYRLEGLRVIDAGTREEWRGISAVDAATAVGKASDIPRMQSESLMVRPPTSLVRDTFEAYQAGEITLRPYAQLLGIDTQSLRQQMSANEEV